MHFYEDIWVNTEVCPIDIPIPGIITGLDPPSQALRDFRNNWILSHCINEWVLETLMVILFKFLNLSILSIFGLRTCTLLDYCESLSSDSLSSLESLRLGIIKLWLIIIHFPKWKNIFTEFIVFYKGIKRSIRYHGSKNYFLASTEINFGKI